jgi:SAM-dependent methyltransferase
VLDFDEGASRRLEETYRTPDIVAQRRATVAALRLQPGEHVLDIGAGPGFLAEEMAAVVGRDGAVHGVDVSASMLAIAARRDAGPDGAPLTFAEGDALDLPYEDERFDAVVSTQVYEYIEDMPAALAEARRILRPGGRLLILDTDWDSVVWHSGDRERMLRVLDAWEEHLAHPDLPRRLGALLEDAGFAVERSDVITILNAGWDERSFSAGLLEMIAGYVPGHRGVTDAEAAAWADELRRLGRAYFFSLCRYVFVARRS